MNQSKLWKQFYNKLRCIISMHRQDNSTNASYRQRVSLPSAMRDCSTYIFQCTSFLKFEFHNKTIFFASVVAWFFLSIGFVNAEEKQKMEDWKPGVEVTIGAHSGYVEEISGTVLFSKPVFIQTAILYAEKKNNGFYIMAANFSPSEQESRETDFYAGFYTKLAGVKIDAGYAYYWWREDLAIDFQGAYALFVFPPFIWQISPFVNAEYRFAEKKITDLYSDPYHRRLKREYKFADENLSGFLYHGGLKREFKFNKRLNITAEVSAGGNTGIYGMEAENLSFVREKLAVTVSLLEQMKLIFCGLTQQNLGNKDGIAADTDKIFISATIALFF
jgi:hypothetical protein